MIESIEKVAYTCADWFLRKNSKPHSSNIQPCGNYFIDISRIDKNHIVYSCGVGKNISFDESLHKKIGCDINLFDPTPVAIDYMNQLEKQEHLKFHTWGVWIEDKPMKFYFKRENKNEKHNLSVTNLLKTDRYVELECFTLETIMKKLSHQQIDILKMDIEGAAMEVLETIIPSDISPKQIIFELEKGRTSLLNFHSRMSSLLTKLRAKGYSLYFLPRDNKKNYNFQFLAVRE